MEKAMNTKQKTLMNELAQGKELARQLKNHLDPESHETCESLVQKILSSYDKALSMLNSSALKDEPLPVSGKGESGHLGNSPKRASSDCVFRDQCHKDVNKKRRTLPRWSKQVRFCSGEGLQSSLDDGYSWRKYGQKDILGADFPRAYYRCSHRNTQGCLATKQVQRSGENPSIFEVTYRGRHTCVQASQSTPPLASFEKEGQEEKKDAFESQQEIQKLPEEMFFDIDRFPQEDENEDLGTKEEIFPSFSLSSTPIETESMETHLFAGPSSEKDSMDSFSYQFLSPAMYESSCFSLSACQTNKIVSAASISVTNPSIGDLDFFLEQVDFDDNFPFESTKIFTEIGTH